MTLKSSKTPCLRACYRASRYALGGAKNYQLRPKSIDGRSGWVGVRVSERSRALCLRAFLVELKLATEDPEITTGVGATSGCRAWKDPRIKERCREDGFVDSWIISWSRVSSSVPGTNKPSGLFCIESSAGCVRLLRVL